MSSLTQRKGNSEKAAPRSSSSQPVQALDPDFVISIAYDIEKDETVATKNLEQITDSLYGHGFFAQVRPQDSSNLLIFIKLGTSAYQEAVTQDLLKSYEFGVTPQPVSASSVAAASERLRIVYQLLTTPQSIGGVGIKSFKFVNTVVPITTSLQSFKHSSIVQDVQTYSREFNPSTNSIKEKFGTKVAFYFEFLKYYIIWLTGLSVFGIVSTLKSKNRFSMTYTFINLLWGVLFITFWNRKERQLANSWGVENSHLVDEHYSELAEINKNDSNSASAHKRGKNADGVRFIKQVVFIPIALVFVATLLSYQLACFVLEIFLSEIYDGPGKSLLTLTPTVLLTVFVPILTIIYNKVADAHIAWESHSNEYTKKNSIIIKQFVLNFLTGYMPLLITSFVYLPFAHLIKPNLGEIEASIIQAIEGSLGTRGHHVHRYLARLKRQDDFEYNQGRLNTQFFYFIVTNQVVQLVLKYVLPFIISFGIKFVNEKILKKKESVSGLVLSKDREDEKEFLDNVRRVVNLPEYNVNDDYRGLILQYGYLVIFGPVWSLAPLVSIAFNIITLKLDITKLKSSKYFQPPIPQRVDSIHPWNYALFILTWIGSIVGPIITSFYRGGTRPPTPPYDLDDPVAQAVDNAIGLDTDADAATPGRRRRFRKGRHGRRNANYFANACVHGTCSNFITLLFLSEHIFFLSYFVLSKFSYLFKSDVEIANDSTTADINLRREHFSSKVQSRDIKSLQEKSGDSSIEQGLWEQYKLQSVLKQARSYASNDDEPENEKVALSSSASNTSKGNSSSYAATPSKSNSTKSKKKNVIEDDEDEPFQFQKEDYTLSENALKKVKDSQDKIISVKDGRGNTSLATIDNNEHFVPPADTSSSSPAVDGVAVNTTHPTPAPPQHKPPSVPASTEPERTVSVNRTKSGRASSKPEEISSSSTDSAIYQNFVQSAERSSKEDIGNVEPTIDTSSNSTEIKSQESDSKEGDVKVGRKKSTLKKLLGSKKK